VELIRALHRLINPSSTLVSTGDHDHVIGDERHQEESAR
jgi:hypothetical protein